MPCGIKLALHTPSHRMCGTKLALLAQNGPIWRVLPTQGELSTAVPTNKPSRANFFTLNPPPDPAGRTFSRTGRTEVVTVKPTTPLQPLIQASMKPPSPLRAPEQHPLKPTTPMQPKNAPKTPNSHPQRRCRFQLKLGLCPQRRCRFHAHVGTHEHRRQRFQTSGPPGRQGQTAVPVVGGRAWPDNEPTRQATRQHTTPHRCGGRRRNRRAWPRCRWAVAGPGRAHQNHRHRRCGERRRVRRARASCKTRGLAAVPVGGGRARAGLEIDHSEPQARVWRSRGRAAAHRHTQRPGPTRHTTRSRPAPSGPGGTRVRRQLSEAADQPTLHVAPSRPSATVTPAAARRSRSSSARAQSLAARAAARSSRTA